jgi:hypothetical protein
MAAMCAGEVLEREVPEVAQQALLGLLGRQCAPGHLIQDVAKRR